MKESVIESGSTGIGRTIAEIERTNRMLNMLEPITFPTAISVSPLCLIAKFLGSIQSPISKFVRTLSAIAGEKPVDGEASAEKVPADEMPVE